MRVYCFNLGILSDKQHGIQSGHAAAKLIRKYQSLPARSKKRKAVEEWADDHVTIIVLNIGTSDNLMELHKHLSLPENPFPWEEFREPDYYNNITSIAVLLPEKLYKDAVIGSEWESKFVKLKEPCRLA